MSYKHTTQRDNAKFTLNNEYVGGKTTLIRECIKLIIAKKKLTVKQAIEKWPKELNGKYEIVVKSIKKEGRYSNEKIKCIDGYVYVTNQWAVNNYKKIVLTFKTEKFINIKKH